MKKYLVIIVILASSCLSLQRNNEASMQDSATLYQNAAYKIGAAIDVSRLRNNALYRNTALREFNSFTPENALKFNRLQKNEGVYDFKDADYFVDFALKNKKRIHGHALLFGESTPDWVKTFKGNFDSLLVSYINTVVSRYKGSIQSWDVVNEAFDNNGDFKKTIWYEKLGPDYIKKAFIAAHKADPKALLFYNDNQLEFQEKRFYAVLSYLNKMKTEGVTIHGIGSQMHVKEYSYGQNSTDKVFQQLAKNGYLIHISELDVGINKSGIKRPFLSTEVNNQMSVYESIVNSYNKVPKALQYGITFWGVSDNDTWLNNHYKLNDAPLLFDSNYKPKKIYDILKQKFKGLN